MFFLLAPAREYLLTSNTLRSWLINILEEAFEKAAVPENFH